MPDGVSAISAPYRCNWRVAIYYRFNSLQSRRYMGYLAFSPSKQVLITSSTISALLYWPPALRNASTGSQARAYRV